jgi:hypothetical protein
MWKWLTARYRHVLRISRLWWIVIPAAWGLFWAVDEMVGKWGWPLARATWDKYTLHIPFDWKLGLIAVLAIMLLLLIEGSYRELSNSELALKRISDAPPDLDVEVLQLFAQDIGGTTRVRAGIEYINKDIFVHAKVNLRSPATAKVDYYRLVITLHGVPSTAIWHTGGFNEWALVTDRTEEKGQIRMRGQKVNELPEHLRCGVSEGWLHFVASWTEVGRIQHSFVYRLEVEGDSWTKHAEVPANAVRYANVFEKIPRTIAS